MPPRTEGNSFHWTLHSLLARWMPSIIFFSVSGRFILIPDIDKIDSALAAAAAAAASTPHGHEQDSSSTPASTSTSASASASTSDTTDSETDSQASSPSSNPKFGYGGRALSMSSYNSMRRQLCAYSFYAIEPHTMPPSELPDGLELNPKSRVWFHVHFYRGATSWRNVPRTVLTKRRQVVRQSRQPSSPAASLENTTTRELDSSRRATIRKSALTYRDALVEIERNTQPAIERVTSSSSPLTKTDSSPSSPSSPLSLASLPSPAMSATVSISMHSLRPLATMPTHVNKANKMSLSFILNSPPRYDPY